jgi:hypothetical protein
MLAQHAEAMTYSLEHATTAAILSTTFWSMEAAFTNKSPVQPTNGKLTTLASMHHPPAIHLIPIQDSVLPATATFIRSMLTGPAL